jgi:hypothetical protein
VSSNGNTPTPLRTGYERVIAHRTDDLYATTAKQKGKVVDVSEKHVIVEYKDGSRQTIELGRRFGTFAGAVIPHSLTCELKAGQTVNEGDVIAYNTNFFQRDRLDPKQVIWKAGVLAKVAFMESPDTLEDSSAISTSLAEKLSSDMSKIRIIRASFDQELRNMVKVGDEVDIESILCTIENPVGGGGSLFDEESLNTLKAVSSLTPKAKTIGRVERIEVLYNGDKEDMSDSLKKVASQSDRDISQRAEVAGKPKTNGRVDGTYRIENRSLDPDSLAIKIYITGPVSAGVGDKGVFASQMKTVIGRVMTGVNRTESGDDLDAIFGYDSLTGRILLSPVLMGTTNTLLRIIGQKAVAAYRGKDAS